MKGKLSRSSTSGFKIPTRALKASFDPKFVPKLNS